MTIIQHTYVYTYVCKNKSKTKIELDQAVEGRVSERDAVDPTSGIPSPQSDGRYRVFKAPLDLDTYPLSNLIRP